VALKLVRNVARVVEYPCANFGDTITIRFRFMGYWAWARRPLGDIDRSPIAANCCCLHGRNWQI